MLNYTIHGNTASGTGQPQSLPELPVRDGTGDFRGERLALDTASAAIRGPCELRLDADEDVTIDVRDDAGDLAPGASPLVLRAGVAAWFSLPAGEAWYISASAA
jgi:hypothetical protein